MFKSHLKVSKGLLVPDPSGNVNLTMWTMRWLKIILYLHYHTIPNNKSKACCEINNVKPEKLKLYINGLYICELTGRMDAPSLFIHM